ncbi:MAG: 16S rRNA (cytidine(1402)-2'-O)-methyltransferase [Chloroflexi bacterium]|nr:16S rRNA (cytidine(1402)-2'-O)-methyltransferase [Chloroflexota bacterium]
MTKSGTLYIVATPIGNPRDITLHALDVLQAVDAIICEESRIGSTLLKRLGITGKELLLLNEHNEGEKAGEMILRLLQGHSLALISDAGTPVFADPGHYLIHLAAEAGIPVVPVAGPSSLMAALSILDFKPEKFIYAGFLPRENDPRLEELHRLRSLRLPIVVMDTPYRLERLLGEVAAVFGKNQPITLACNLTLPDEAIYRGPIAQIRQQLKARKAEFLLIIHATGAERKSATKSQ